MKATEQYVRLCGSVGHLSKRLTGDSIVDAYFGPPELSPDRQNADMDPDSLVHELGCLVDNIKSTIRDPLRREYLLSDARSMQALVEWLGGAAISYAELVKRLFNIEMKSYSEGDIDRQIERVDEAYAGFPGGDLRDRIDRFDRNGELSGQELKNLIEGELQQKASDVGSLFKEKVFSKIGVRIRDNGVQYKAVIDKPWGSYNYYLGDFKSLNVFNIDYPNNPTQLLSATYHEYEHHVQSLCREHLLHKKRYLELSILPLHTGHCVILEGTADSAKDFLGVADEDPNARAIRARGRLYGMVMTNAAVMMNVRGLGVEETSEYISDRAFERPDIAPNVTRFFNPKADNGQPNIWAPYVFTYDIGRTDFVMPTFNKAVEQGLVAEFFKTLYLNPFSGSSATWKMAFDWL